MDGQTYGDSIHFRRIGDGTSRYSTISESSFLALVDKPFFFRWSSSYDALFANFAIDGEGASDASATGALQSKLASSGLPIFSSNSSSGTILSAFPKSSVDTGYVIGIVNQDASIVYDMTDRITTYRNAGSYTRWDFKDYDTVSGTNSKPSYVLLDDRGMDNIIGDVTFGKQYVLQKKQEEVETEKIIQNYTNYTYKEIVSFTNADDTIYTYYTNKTIIVDPYFKNLNSILEFEYPKFATEGDYILYRLTRTGVLAYPLTVHLVTNGHWCANVSWSEKEGGTKTVRVKTGVNDDIDDNSPLEVVVKTLSRKVDTR